ncbi:MAG TPA: sigma factor, partial [Xanthobacteraceae bacterium]|nr:sigma factor [Xanthobacteraceae bacterium]
MARAAKGDERAFRILAERHAGAALRLARRILGNEAAAEDAVQDALVQLLLLRTAASLRCGVDQQDTLGPRQAGRTGSPPTRSAGW